MRGGSVRESFMYLQKWKARSHQLIYAERREKSQRSTESCAAPIGALDTKLSIMKLEEIERELAADGIHPHELNNPRRLCHSDGFAD